MVLDNYSVEHRSILFRIIYAVLCVECGGSAHSIFPDSQESQKPPQSITRGLTASSAAWCCSNVSYFW